MILFHSVKTNQNLSFISCIHQNSTLKDNETSSIIFFIGSDNSNSYFNKDFYQSDFKKEIDGFIFILIGVFFVFVVAVSLKVTLLVKRLITDPVKRLKLKI